MSLIPRPGRLALVLSGGGARAAYQVGVLQAISERIPDLNVPILTGVSAGAINAAFLAAYRGSLKDAVAALRREWLSLDSGKVYGLRPELMVRSTARWFLNFISTWRRQPSLAAGLFESGPLRESLSRVIDFQGIEENLREGRLHAVALTATSYSSGLTTTFVHGRPELQMWRRALRKSVKCRLTLDTVMASSAIPMVFPAVKLEDGYYGDGSLRQTSPLAPAIHLGADRLLAVAPGPKAEPLQASGPPKFPTAADMMGVLLDAMFLDAVDMDAELLERINRLLGDRDPQTPVPDGLRPLELTVLRPTTDLGALAEGHRRDLPRTMRVLMYVMGSGSRRGTRMLSYLLFEPPYIEHLMQLGHADAQARWPVIERFLAGGA